jgi:hypothetical protein
MSQKLTSMQILISIFLEGTFSQNKGENKPKEDQVEE